MKIRVVINVELDDDGIEARRTTFGKDKAKREITRDVKSYIGNEAQCGGVFGSGEVDATITWE